MSANSPRFAPAQCEISPAQLIDLGILLRREFEARGRIEDLIQAIDYQMRAICCTLAVHEGLAGWFDELGISLHLRFKHFDNLEDIERAIQCHERARELTPDSHKDLPRRVKNLGFALQSRFERLANPSDLARGISYLNQAILLSPEQDSRSVSGSRLATSSGSSEITPVEINKSMPAAEILAHLVNHGCPDLTPDLETLSAWPAKNGGLGLVYCDTLRDGSKVAVKTLACLNGMEISEETLLKRAAHELHVWSKCTHSYVQELLGVAYVRNQFAMISPWLEHGSLPEYMKRNPMIDRCKMCTQIAEGLAYLHGRDIIHGDIKGPNILVANDHTPRLTDFGNATLREYSLRFATSNTKNPISWRWAAPELYKEGKESKEADIYALGMTILEVIMGQAPFYTMKDYQIMPFILAKNIHSRPENFIPTQSLQGNLLWSILLKCWAFESTERPSAEEVCRGLSTITPEGLHPIATVE